MATLSSERATENTGSNHFVVIDVKTLDSERSPTCSVASQRVVYDHPPRVVTLAMCLPCHTPATKVLLKKTKKGFRASTVHTKKIKNDKIAPLCETVVENGP